MGNWSWIECGTVPVPSGPKGHQNRRKIVKTKSYAIWVPIPDSVSPSRACIHFSKSCSCCYSSAIMGNIGLSTRTSTQFVLLLLCLLPILLRQRCWWLWGGFQLARRSSETTQQILLPQNAKFRHSPSPTLASWKKINRIIIEQYICYNIP